MKTQIVLGNGDIRNLVLVPEDDSEKLILEAFFYNNDPPARKLAARDTHIEFKDELAIETDVLRYSSQPENNAYVIQSTSYPKPPVEQ